MWAMFYGSVMGMGLHPGTTRDAGNKMTPAEGAVLADAMLLEYRARFADGSE